MLDLGAEGVNIQDPEEIRQILAAPDSLSYADSDFFDQLGSVVCIQAYFLKTDRGVYCKINPEAFSAALIYQSEPKQWVSIQFLEEMIQKKLLGFREFLPVGKGYQGWQTIHEENWANNWKQYYQTQHLTRRLVINPSWLDYQPTENEIVIALDPGSAFGTGTHESTALCSEILDEIIDSESCVLDLGTGSGILAIIAARLGASRVEAIDIDPKVIQIARHNSSINKVPVDVHTGTLADVSSPPYNVIVANIIADVLIELMPDFLPVLSDDGLLILSGIIQNRQSDVKQAVGAAGFKTVALRTRNDWCTFVVQKQPVKQERVSN